MRKILKEELGRALRSGGMVAALIIGSVVALAQVIQYQIPAYRINQAMDFEKVPILSLYTISDSWMGGSPIYLETFLYFLILPILAALPFGTSYFTDRSSGFTKGIYTRSSRKQYLTAKYVAALISGGIAVSLPLLLNLACGMVLLPNLVAPSILPHNGINAGNMLHTIYFSKPLLYILAFLCTDFALGGLWACAALASSFLSDYKIVVLICPFFIQLGIHVVCTMLNKIKYSSVYFAQSGYGLSHTWILIAYLIMGVSATWIVFRKKGEKEDVF